jgi:translocation and assembly module TamB
MRFLLHIVLVVALAAISLPVHAQNGSPEEDQGIITRFLQDLLTDAGRVVQIRGFEGALASRATMEELTIADDEGVWLIIRGAVLDWNRRALFQRILSINELSADEIEIRRLPVGADDDPLPSPTARPEFRLPELPVSITIGMLRAERVILGDPVLGEDAVLRLQGQAQLEGGEGYTSFVAERIDGREGIFRFEGAFDNLTRVLTVDLELTEGPDGIAANLLDIPERPSVELAIAGSGPLENFAAEIRLGTDGEERVAGTVLLDDVDPIEGEEVAQHFELDLAGDLRPLLQPALHTFFGTDSRLRARGSRAEDGAVSLYELTFNTRTVRLAGRADFDASGLPQVIQLIADVALPNGTPMPIPGTDGNVRLREAALNIDYDAEVSPDWLIEAAILDLLLPDLRIAEVDLVAQGQLQPPGMGNGPFFDGGFDFAARGIDAVDPGLQQALGEAVTGLMRFRMPSLGEPVEIEELTFAAETVSLTAQGLLTGLEFDGAVEASVPDLSAFSGLAGEELGGSALFTGRGMVNLLTTALDVDLELIGTDLSVNVAELDRFLAGESAIRASVRRDQVGSVLRDFALEAGTLSVVAAGQHQPGSVFLYSEVEIADLSRLGPGYGGAAQLEARFESDTLGTRQLFLSGFLRDIELGAVPGAEQAAALLRGTTEIDAALTFDELGVLIERASIASDQIAFDARGRWSETAPDLVAQLRRLDLDELRPGMEGLLQGEARYFTRLGEGRVVDLQLGSVGPIRTGEAAVDDLLADGVEVTARLLLPDAGGLVVEAGELSARGVRVTAEGQQAPDGAAQFALTGELDDIGRLVENVSGPVRIAGTVGRPAGATAYDTDLALTGPMGLDLRAVGQVDESLQMDLQLTGTVDAAIANPFIAPNSVAGLVGVDVTVQGPPELASVRGVVTMSDGSVTLAEPGLTVGAINASAEFTPLAVGDLRVAFSGTIAEVALGGLPGAAVAAPLVRGTTQVEGAVTLDEMGVLIERLAVSGEQVAFEASGRWSETAPDITARLQRLNLAGLRPGLAGSLQGDARFFTRPGERVIDLQLAGAGLRLGQQPVDGLLAGGVSLDARLLLPDAGGVVVDTAELTAPGLRIAADGRQGPDGAANFTITGTLDNIGRVVPELAGPVRLTASATRPAGAAAFDTDFALTGPAGLDLRGTGRIDDGLQNLDLRVSGTVDAAIANPFIPPNSVQGPVRLDLTVQGAPALTSVSGTAALTGGGSWCRDRASPSAGSRPARRSQVGRFSSR